VDSAYEDVASKFWEHFLSIAHAINHLGQGGEGMWDQEDGFFYDVMHPARRQARSAEVRSMVGLIPLFAVDTLEPRPDGPVSRLQAPYGMVHRNRRDLTTT